MQLDFKLIGANPPTPTKHNKHQHTTKQKNKTKKTILVKGFSPRLDFTNRRPQAKTLLLELTSLHDVSKQKLSSSNRLHTTTSASKTLCPLSGRLYK
ncbi:hypothetical protein J6590_037536 [Homalodisca vitripennis]|nr:hypothetical protein J6590_037536 [Homalodisca vitripennis]